MPSREWSIEFPLPDTNETQWFELCRCDSPQTVAAVIQAVLSAGKNPPVAIAIRERRRVGQDQVQ